MPERTFIVGVGMTKFDKPGHKEGGFPDWAEHAGRLAITDAGIDFSHLRQAYASYVYGDSTSGQRAIYGLGTTGIPINNVNNNCSSGSSALFLARQAVKYGAADCVLAIGFEQMERGSLGMKFPQHPNPLERHLDKMSNLRKMREEIPFAPQLYANAALDHMERYGSMPDHYAWIGWKNHKHSVNNPYAQFQDEYGINEIKASRMVAEPLTKLQCSPTSDGAAAAVVASERFVADHGLWARAVEIAGQAMTTDVASTFDDTANCMTVIGCDMSRNAARSAYDEARIAPADVDVCELHDCFSSNELITYEALGFAETGKGHHLVETEATTYGGSAPVVNPSGGLISKGHPLGATGLAQCAELTWQLRGLADNRQVEGADVALQHNQGLGGATVVTVYKSVER